MEDTGGGPYSVIGEEGRAIFRLSSRGGSYHWLTAASLGSVQFYAYQGHLNFFLRSYSEFEVGFIGSIKIIIFHPDHVQIACTTWMCIDVGLVNVLLKFLYVWCRTVQSLWLCIWP